MDGEWEIETEEQRRELVRQATGVLVARYELESGDAESVLMDWSSLTGVAVFELAEQLVADVRQGTPDRQGARDLLRQVSAGAQPDQQAHRSPAQPASSGPGSDLWVRALLLTTRARETGMSLADTADRIAQTFDALAHSREQRGIRTGDQQALERARVTRQRADAERDEAAHLRRTYGAASSR